MKVLKICFLMLLASMMAGCSSDNVADDEAQVILWDISGIWVEYAYLSDGIFFDISDAHAVTHYDFAVTNNPDNPFAFTQYTIDENGQKDIQSQGEWTFDMETQTAHVEESRGWNLDIAFAFSETDDATMTIKGRTSNSNRTIKAKRTKAKMQQ